MQKIINSFTLLFDPPFWIGLYERRTDTLLEVSRIVFGAEPKDYEVYQFLLHSWCHLKFSQPIQDSEKRTKQKNPKRQRREINKQIGTIGIGTKAQQAIKLQQTQGKLARKSKKQAAKEEAKRQQFTLKQEKKKQKHKGH